jgi:hypothetical protein
MWHRSGATAVEAAKRLLNVGSERELREVIKLVDEHAAAMTRSRSAPDVHMKARRRWINQAINHDQAINHAQGGMMPT